MRTIKRISKAFKVNMGGTMLDQALPDNTIDQIDPFLLIHHWSDRLKGGKKQEQVGVGPHPHRGFSPITFIFKGSIQHRDSTGANSIIKAGGTQWMNSGKGLVHSERPTKELAEHGGDFEIIQFWLNAPAKHKLDEPNYQPLQYEDTPRITSEDGKITVGLVAGELMGKKGKIEANSEVLILRINYTKGGKLTIPIPNNYNALLYNLNGEGLANNQAFSDKDMIHFNNLMFSFL